MSLNDIKMPPQLIASLFADTLVETSLEEISLKEFPEAASSYTEISLPEKKIITERSIQKEEPVNEQLVNPSKEQPTGPVEEKSVKVELHPFDFMGSNKKKILILVAHDKSPYLPDHELKFLLSILKACGLTTEDVAILNLKKHPSDHEKLQVSFQNRISLLFGQEPRDIDLPMNFPQFQLQNYNQCKYLHIPGLSEIEKTKELKMKLWSCLKNLFSL